MALLGNPFVVNVTKQMSNPELAQALRVDIAAPGDNITSTIPGGKYGAKNGTSMATPHVTGAAALVVGQLKLQGTPWTTQEIFRRVTYNNDNIGLSGFVRKVH